MPIEKKPFVYIVDDDEYIRKALEIFLEQEGFELLSAASGKEILDDDDSNPDIVLLDIDLPAMNGIEVCKKLRSRFKKNISIVFMSGRVVHPELEKQMNEAGADAFISKPFNLQEISDKIRHFLSSRVPQISA